VTGDSSARLRVDPIACDGRGLCAKALPKLITLDDWGFPITSGQPVPAWLLADARETVRACPKLALRLERLRSPQPPRHRDSQPMSGL
jgi:ferredoxin